MPTNQLTPKGYKSILSLRETERGIKLVKDFFQVKLAEELSLQRVSAPLFVMAGSGINDDLNGVERKVTFQVKYDSSIKAEVVFALTKWKRMALADYGFEYGEGLYTDMDAIRPDEEVLDNLHSIYVDQWDWERVIKKEERSLDFLKEVVRRIYKVMGDTEKMIYEKYEIKPVLPEDITFIHTEDLIEEYSDLTPLEREDKISEKYGAVFLIGIGGELRDGSIHDGRAPDYDDWSTPTEESKKGLNGDIIIWHPLLKKAFEITSMGIRVDKETMLKQLKIRGCEERKEMEWHRRLLLGEFPLSVGGGIGQSRLCMFFLRKAHIGEVQSSIWPDSIREHCRDNGIVLL